MVVNRGDAQCSGGMGKGAVPRALMPPLVPFLLSCWWKDSDKMRKDVCRHEGMPPRRAQ